MKGFAFWLLKRFYGLDIDALQNDNKRLREENGRHVSRTNSLKKDKEVLSEKIVRLDEENTIIQDNNQKLIIQIEELQLQINEQIDKLKKDEADHKKNISQLEETIDDIRQENNSLKSSLDGVSLPSSNVPF